MLIRPQILCSGLGQLLLEGGDSCLFFKGFYFFIVGEYTWQNLLLWPFLNVRIQWLYMVVQRSPPSTFRTFSSSQIEALSPSNNNAHFPLSPAPGNHPSTFCVYEFAYLRYLPPLGVSRKARLLKTGICTSQSSRAASVWWRWLRAYAERTAEFLLVKWTCCMCWYVCCFVSSWTVT